MLINIVMKKILIAYSCIVFIIISINAQTSSDTLGKGTAFFMEIKKTSCNAKGDCSEWTNPYLECFNDDLFMFAANAKGERTLSRVFTNDSIKAKQCVSIKYSNRSFLDFWGKNWQGGVKMLEYTFNCKIIDTTMNLETWVVEVGRKIEQSTPLVHNQELHPISYSGTVFMPNEYIDETNFLVTKDGTLNQLMYEIENTAKHIVIAKDPKLLSNRYTFEMPAQPIWSADFDKIHEELKKTIDFEMYKAVMPIKVTYLKFLE
jgi:hypothetical protein